MKIYFDQINSIKLFKGLLEEQLAEILDLSKYSIKHYSKSQIIHLEKEGCHSIDFILEGRVSVQKIDKGGNAVIISSFNAGDAVGANLLFSKNNYYPFHVIAASQTTILHLDERIILELCKDSQDFMIHLLEFISDHSLRLTEKINAITLKTLRQKILDFLESERIRQNDHRIRLPITKKELAENLGIQRTSLSRELNKMRSEGLIDFNLKEITIIDKQR